MSREAEELKYTFTLTRETHAVFTCIPVYLNNNGKSVASTHDSRRRLHTDAPYFEIVDQFLVSLPRFFWCRFAVSQTEHLSNSAQSFFMLYCHSFCRQLFHVYADETALCMCKPALSARSLARVPCLTEASTCELNNRVCSL